jgi:hypothetical protein
MPEDHDERAGFDDRSGFNRPDDFDDLDDFEDGDEDADNSGEVRHAWPASGYPPPGYPPLTGQQGRPGGHGARRGLLIAAIALATAAAGFGLAEVAIGDVASPAASAAPNSGTPGTGGSGNGAPTSGAGNGTQLSPQASGLPSLPPGATERLEVGGPVTAVSATSITVGGGDHSVTAAVTRATKITGKVTGIGGIRVGDLVSASITGTDGKLTANSIQDPASLPSASGQ